MNLNNLTIKSQEALQRAQQLASANESQSIELGHLMKAILDSDENVTPFLFKKLGVNPAVVKQTIDAIVSGYPKVSGGEQYLARSTAEALQKANTFLKEFGDEYVAIEHILLGILKTKDAVSTALHDAGIAEKELKTAIRDLRKGSKANTASAEEAYNALKKYATNLNERARSGKLDPVIGRDEEIRRVREGTADVSPLFYANEVLQELIKGDLYDIRFPLVPHILLVFGRTF